MSVSKRRVVSLFSGAMGLDLGLESSGFETVFANDSDAAAVATIKHNRPSLPVVHAPIETLDYATILDAAGLSAGSIDLVAGGPPCQSFSVYGRRGGTFDSRGRLIYEFVRLVGELQPAAFLMENVRGLHSMPRVPKNVAESINAPQEYTVAGSLLTDILKRFEDTGYRVDCFLVNAVNYGAPQLRERLICIGNRFDSIATFPEPIYSNRPEDSLPPFRTLGDVIGDGFSDPDPDCMNFSERKLRYLAMVPAGGNWRSLPIEVQKESMGKAWYLKGGRSAYWRKLSFEFPSPTIVTMPNHAGTSMCHPVELRALTAGECAAIQEFPTSWRLQGSTVEKYRQIGNAVPVRLGRVAGESLTRLFEEFSTRKPSEPSLPSRIVHIRPHVRTRTFWKNGRVHAGGKCYYDHAEPEQPLLFD